MRVRSHTFFLVQLFLVLRLAFATDVAALCADRAAVEHIYYEHRTGTKAPFAEVMPPALVEKLVRADLKKEMVLERVYRVRITTEMLATEVQRINTTTRAPEMLAEIKSALGNDPERFAATMARPILVERFLHSQFENDTALHAPQRAVAEKIRNQILAAKETTKRLAILKENKDATFTEATWQLGARPAEAVVAGNHTNLPTTPSEAKSSSGSYSNEATVQLSQVVNSPEKNKEEKFYFEDLQPELQNVLRVQLQKPGDVSAVIETPGAFLLFVAKENSPAQRSAASLTVPKRSYDAWLAEQPNETK